MKDHGPEQYGKFVFLITAFYVGVFGPPRSSSASTLRTVFTGENVNYSVVVLYDPSPSLRDVAITREALDHAGERLRVLRMHRMGDGSPRIFTEHYVANLYDEVIRDDLLQNGVHAIPGDGNDLITVGSMLDHCTSPEGVLDGIPCGVYASGLPFESVTLGVLPRAMDAPIPRRHGVFIVSGNPSTVAYNTYAGDERLAEVAWEKVKNVPINEREKTDMNGLLHAFDRLQEILDQAKSTGAWTQWNCAPVHVILVSDLRYTESDLPILAEKIRALRERYSSPVFVHALLLSSNKSTQRKALNYVINPGGGGILSWLSVYHDPFATLMQASGMPIHGTCRMEPSMVQDNGEPTLFGFSANFPEGNGETTLFRRETLRNAPYYDEIGCTDRREDTPCGKSFLPQFLYKTPEVTESSWQNRRVFFADPRGALRTCRAEPSGTLSGCDINAAGRVMGVDPVTATYLVRFVMGDPKTEVDYGENLPESIFRNRCRNPHTPEYDCKNKTTLENPTPPGTPYVLLAEAPWTQEDSFEHFTPLTDAERSVPLEAPIIVYVSTVEGVRAYHVPPRNPSAAEELWTFVPLQEEKFLFRDALPGAVPYLPAELYGLRGDGKAYLVGLYSRMDQHGFFVLDVTNPEEGPQLILESSVSLPSSRNFRKIRAHFLDYRGEPQMVFGPGYQETGPPPNKLCLYRVGLTSRSLDSACQNVGENILAVSALAREGTRFFVAAHGEEHVILAEGSLHPQFRIQHYVKVKVDKSAFEVLKPRPVPTELWVTQNSLTLVGPDEYLQQYFDFTFFFGIERKYFKQAREGELLTLSPNHPEEYYVWAQKFGSTLKAYRENRPWYPCGEKICRAWGLVLKGFVPVYPLARIGSKLWARDVYAVREKVCKSPMYGFVVLRRYWFYVPSPLDFHSTRFSYAFKVSTIDETLGAASPDAGPLGYLFDGPVLGALFPRASWTDLVVLYADGTHEGESRAVRFRHTMERGVFEPSPYRYFERQGHRGE